MSGLAVRNKSGEKIHYTGSQFEGLGNVGSHHLCIRTGSGPGDVVKYALTDRPLNDKYKALRMRISGGAGSDAGKDAYIAQRYTTSTSESTYRTYTTTRVSNYVSSTTLRTNSSTRLQTGNATRTVSQTPSYYGSKPVKFTTTLSDLRLGNSSMAGAYLGSKIVGNFLIGASSSTTMVTSYMFFGNVTRINYNTTKQTGIFSVCLTSNEYTVTRILSTKVSNYISSTTLRTNSSSKLQTGNATRASTYNTSSSASQSKQITSHNANL